MSKIEMNIRSDPMDTLAPKGRNLVFQNFMMANHKSLASFIVFRIKRVPVDTPAFHAAIHKFAFLASLTEKLIGFLRFFNGFY